MTILGRVLASIITFPAILLGAFTWSGYALGQGSTPMYAFIFSLLMFTLPALGLAALGKFRPGAMVLGGWMWSIIALGAGPLFFPGEREDALDRGLTWAQGVAPGAEPALEKMASFGGMLFQVLGEDPSPPPEAPAIVTPAPVVEEVSRSILEGGEEEEPVLRLPVDNVKGSIRVPVTLIGPQGREQVEMIFDTGATMTTLEPSVIKKMGIPLPKDLPKITLHTAGGSRDVRVAFLDGVELEGGGQSAQVPGVSVAVCKGCSGEGTVGLLGLNVTSLFQVTMDYEGGGIELRTRGEDLDRLTDIRHWLDVKSQATQGAFGPVEVELEVTNRSPSLVSQVDVEVSCKSRSFSIQLDDIKAGATGRTEVSIPRDSDCGRYALSLIGGRW